jgi:hypothetical protein
MPESLQTAAQKIHNSNLDKTTRTSDTDNIINTTTNANNKTSSAINLLNQLSTDLRINQNIKQTILLLVLL